jgi:hypothetical protein
MNQALYAHMNNKRKIKKKSDTVAWHYAQLIVTFHQMFNDVTVCDG